MSQTRTVRVLTDVPDAWISRLAASFPSVEIVHLPESGPLPNALEGEIFVTVKHCSPHVEELVKRGVRWIHMFGTGVDGFPFEALGGHPLTCSRGMSAVPIGEWVLAMLLAAEKKLPESWDTAADVGQWESFALGSLHGKTLGLVGMGGIGCAVAERALAFGMQVRACRRRPGPSPLARIEMTHFDELLPIADHLVLAAPATPETHQLLNADAFARVKPGVHLVNVARGSLVDQEALRAALDDGRVSLASLDVTDPEPLPEGHWLYSHPRVHLSGHISWSEPEAIDRILESLQENLALYLADEPLRHVVDIERGY